MLTEDELVAAQHEELRALQWESIPANRAAAELATERKLEEGLLWAAEAGNVEVATTLIKAGASVSARCRLNCTPVYIASQTGHTEIARLLIRTVRTAAAPWGADPVALVATFLNQACLQGETALMVAAEQGHTNCVALLLQNRASVNVKGDRGDTALHFAAKTCLGFDGQDVYDSMALLLAHGADIEATNSAGLTALGSCILDHLPEQTAINRAKWLIKKGASLAALLVPSVGAAWLPWAQHGFREPPRPPTVNFILANLTSTSMAEQAKYIVPLLEHHRPDVRMNSMRVLQMVTAADLSERATTIVRMLVRLNRAYTGVIEPLRAHLFPADVSRRAFVTCKTFVEAIAARRTDTVPEIRDMAMNWIKREIPLAHAPANVLVAAVHKQTQM